MSTSQKRTHKRSSPNGLRSALTLSGCLLVVAACGSEAPPAGTMAAPGTGAPTGTPTAGSTPTGAAGSTTAGAAGNKGPATGAPKAGTGAPTGAAGAAVPKAGTTGGAAAGSAAAGSGAAGTPAMGAAGGGAAGSGAAGGPATPDEGSGGESACLDGLDGFDKAGPFEFSSESEGAVNFWVPKLPAGCKTPIIHLANGTGASCSSYGQALERFATWGFLTTCYENPNTGAGMQGLEAFMTALSKYPDLALKRFGSTGHSQGGQASFIVLQLAEDAFGVGPDTKFAGLAMQPASGFGSQPQGGSWQSIYAKIKSPMFMFSGQGSDGLVSQGWVQDAFNNLDKGIEAYFWAKQGGMHIPTPQGEEMQIGPAWFRWKLLGDKKACEYFKAIPMTDSTWMEVDVQNAAACQ